MTSRQHLQQLLTLSEQNSNIMEIKPCYDQEKADDLEQTAYPDDYLFHFLRNSRDYSCILKYDNYQEIDDTILEYMNTDWTNNVALRQACSQALAGSIIVEGRHVLLVNCIEIYARKPTLDRHFERFSNTSNQYSSIPTLKSRYKNFGAVILFNHRSRKLVFGSQVFNALVTSSMRLDIDADPEVGSSTTLFTPTLQQKIYLSQKSLDAAKVIINSEKKCFNQIDIFSQFRQLQSQFSSPSTYFISRCSSLYVDNIACRPFTVFTLADAEGNTLTIDVKIGSQIFQAVAKGMLFNKGKLEKENLTALTRNGKETKVEKILLGIINLFDENNGELAILKNEDLDSHLFDLAFIITPKIREYNQSVIKNIKQSFSEL